MYIKKNYNKNVSEIYKDSNQIKSLINKILKIIRIN